MSKAHKVSPILKVMRPNCYECGNEIEWFTFEEATKDRELFNFMVEVLTVMGPIPGPAVDVWRCPNCGETGLML